jgi:hypothetical protein
MAAQLIATNAPRRRFDASCRPRASSSLPCRSPQQHDRDVGAGHPFDRARNLDHFRRRGDHPAQHLVVRPGAIRQRAVFGLDPVEVQRAAHDQAQRIDIDRLLIEIIGALGDRGQRAFARAWPLATITLVSGLSAMISSSTAKPSLVPSGSGGSPDRASPPPALRPQQRQGAGAIAGDKHVEILVGPFELGLKAGIVLDDQQQGAPRSSCHFLFIGTFPGSGTDVLFGGGSQRQADREAAAQPFPAFHIKPPAHGAHHFARFEGADAETA